MTWTINFWYSSREEWEAGKARCADLRAFDDQGRLVECHDIPIDVAIEATKNSVDCCEVVDDGYPDAYSQVEIGEEIARSLLGQ